MDRVDRHKDKGMDKQLGKRNNEVDSGGAVPHARDLMMMMMMLHSPQLVSLSHSSAVGCWWLVAGGWWLVVGDRG